MVHSQLFVLLVSFTLFGLVQCTEPKNEDLKPSADDKIRRERGIDDPLETYSLHNFRNPSLLHEAPLKTGSYQKLQNYKPESNINEFEVGYGGTYYRKGENAAHENMSPLYADGKIPAAFNTHLYGPLAHEAPFKHEKLSDLKENYGGGVLHNHEPHHTLLLNEIAKTLSKLNHHDKTALLGMLKSIDGNLEGKLIDKGIQLANLEKEKQNIINGAGKAAIASIVEKDKLAQLYIKQAEHNKAHEAVFSAGFSVSNGYNPEFAPVDHAKVPLTPIQPLTYNDYDNGPLTISEPPPPSFHPIPQTVVPVYKEELPTQVHKIIVQEESKGPDFGGPPHLPPYSQPHHHEYVPEDAHHPYVPHHPDEIVKEHTISVPSFNKGYHIKLTPTRNSPHFGVEYGVEYGGVEKVINIPIDGILRVGNNLYGKLDTVVNTVARGTAKAVVGLTNVLASNVPQYHHDIHHH